MRFDVDERPVFAHTFAFVCVALLGWAAYFNSLHIPFVFDDVTNILTNPAMRNITLLFDSEANAIASGTAGTLTYFHGQTRLLPYFTFYLNYTFGGTNVAWYHVVNILCHIGTSFLVYALSLNIQRAARVARSVELSAAKSSNDSTSQYFTALAAGLLFVAHPLNSQAVNYITQRFTLLATFFVLASTTIYVVGRVHLLRANSRDERVRGFSLLALALALALLAYHSKEISATTWLLLYAIEFTVFTSKTRSLRAPIPFLLCAVVIPAQLLAPSGGASVDVTQTMSSVPRAAYFFSQTEILWTYLRLVFLPYDLHLDRFVPLTLDALNVTTILSCAALVTTVVLCIRASQRALPLALLALAFGWFFLAHSLESSIVVLGDLIFEHRTYLPMAGFLAALSPAVFATLTTTKSRISLAVPALLVVVTFTVATTRRNDVWSDELTLWLDSVEKSPLSPRGQMASGLVYSTRGEFEKAIPHFEAIMALYPDHTDAALALLRCYRELRRADDVERMVTRVRALAENDLQVAFFLAVHHYYSDELDAAEREARRAINGPQGADAHRLLGSINKKRDEN